MRELESRLASLRPVRVSGQVHRLLGAVAESRGLFAPIGAQCEILLRSGQRLPAEVVGFRGEHALVAPCGDTRGLAAGDRIEYRGEAAYVRVHPAMVGSVIDADGRAMDRAEEGDASPSGIEVPLHRGPGNPLRRLRVDRPLATGIRAVDALCTVGRGQRLGIFAGSGVGKSVLLGMLARNTRADVVVIGLIGERGREVREFVEHELGERGRGRSIVVAATAEEPALRRLKAALVATAVAEHFRDRGRSVLLLMDSLSRVAMAQRELGLAMGEPPATRGYPPSVFAFLPRLLERAGPGEQGSITGFFTALVEADDPGDPIVDCVRAALDGQLFLSRQLAERGHFPAIDPLASLSRAQAQVVDANHLEAARSLRGALARYRDSEELIHLGAYVSGADPRTDRAVRLMPRIEPFLRQERNETADFDASVRDLLDLARELDRENESAGVRAPSAEVSP